MKTNVYQMVTDRIVEQMNKGIIPWHKPWHSVSGEAINYVSRKPYSPLNCMLLWKGGEWLTYKQIEKLGGRIKKGEKGSFVVYYQNGYDKKVKTPDDLGNEVEKLERIICPMLRYYNVWHIDQVEGIESKIEQSDETHVDPIEEAERVMTEYAKREGITFRTDGKSAYYSPSQDLVVVPPRDYHFSAAEYYSTAYHEFTHSTGHKSRLNRFKDEEAAAFGGEEYSKEELVAEIGSAFSLSRLGIDCKEAFNNSIAYLQGWVKHLQDHPREIVFAAGQAEKAVKLIFNETK